MKHLTTLKVWIAYGCSSFFGMVTNSLLPEYYPTPEILEVIKATAQAAAFVVTVAYTIYKFYFDVKDRIEKVRKKKRK